MKIKNVTNGMLSISDLPGPQGMGLTLSPQAEKLIYDEDAEKSSQLLSLMTSGLVTKLSDEEPADSGATADADAAAAVALAAAALPKSGGTMTGAIAMGGFKVTGLGAPTGAADAARKSESDAAMTAASGAQADATQALSDAAAAQGTADAALPKAGGTMSGPIAMGGSKITGLAAGTLTGDAARFDEVDAAMTAANDAQADATQALSDAAAAAATANAALPAANLMFIDSAVSVGGAETETMTFTGLLATDTILALTMKASGTAGGLLGFANQVNNALDVTFNGDPGAGAVVRLALKR